MFKSKWMNLSGVSLIGLAALTLAACDDSQRVSDAGQVEEQPTIAEDVPEYTQDEENLTAGEVDTQPDRDPAYEDRLAGADVPNTEDQVAAGIDNPFYLRGRDIATPDGEPYGEVTQIVVDDAQNVFAVIELDGAQATARGAGTVVVDVDDIDREQNMLVLMSQAANLEPYVPEDYKPLGTRTEP